MLLSRKITLEEGGRCVRIVDDYTDRIEESEYSLPKPIEMLCVGLYNLMHRDEKRSR